MGFKPVTILYKHFKGFIYKMFSHYFLVHVCFLKAAANLLVIHAIEKQHHTVIFVTHSVYPVVNFIPFLTIIQPLLLILYIFCSQCS